MKCFWHISKIVDGWIIWFCQNSEEVYWLLGISVPKIRTFAKNTQGQNALELHFSRTDMPSSQYSGF
jgi:hypothetical protein